MKQKQKTREELVSELAKEMLKNESWVASDETRRKEFAKAFSWFKKRGQYDYSDEILTPSWTEIFIKIGKLLVSKDFYDFEGNLSELECKLENLESKIKTDIHPNL